jgi:hypothetical protein
LHGILLDKRDKTKLYCEPRVLAMGGGTAPIKRREQNLKPE